MSLTIPSAGSSPLPAPLPAKPANPAADLVEQLKQVGAKIRRSPHDGLSHRMIRELVQRSGVS